MEAFDITIRFIGFFCTVLVAVLGVGVFRQKVYQEAEKRLAQIHTETIEAQKETISQLRIQARIVEDVANNEKHSRKQCEEALRTASAAIWAYDDFIGRIWIDAGIKVNGEIPEIESGGESGSSVDIG